MKCAYCNNKAIAYVFGEEKTFTRGIAVCKNHFNNKSKSEGEGE